MVLDSLKPYYDVWQKHLSNLFSEGNWQLRWQLRKEQRTHNGIVLIYVMTLFVEGFKYVKKWMVSQYPQEMCGEYSSS